MKNSYPDIRVDTSSYLFQFKFEKNYPWTEHFPAAQETRRYLKFVAEKHGLEPADYIFDRELLKADWNESESKWTLQLRLNDGSEETMKVNAVLSGTGLFHTAVRISIYCICVDDTCAERTAFSRPREV